MQPADWLICRCRPVMAGELVVGGAHVAVGASRGAVWRWCGATRQCGGVAADGDEGGEAGMCARPDAATRKRQPGTAM